MRYRPGIRVLEARRAGAHDWLNSEHEAGKYHAGEAVADVEDVSVTCEFNTDAWKRVRCCMEHAPDAVTDKVRLDPKSLLLHVRLDCVADHSDGAVGDRRFDAHLRGER